MSRYLARKTLLYLITLYVAITVDWAIPRLMPGDPINGLIARLETDDTASREMHGYFTESFGLDEPLWRQYLGLLARAPLRRPRPEHRLRRLLRQRADPERDPVHAGAPHSRDRAELRRRQPDGRAGGAAQGARQPVLPPSYILTATPYMWLALVLAYVFAFEAGDLPGLRRVRLLAPA